MLSKHRHSMKEAILFKDGSISHVIEPNNAKDLGKAFEIIKKLKKDIHSSEYPEHNETLQACEELQEEYIKNYIDSLGEYDNSTFIKNVAYLCKKFNIGIGDMEKWLGISTGYLSRTTNENSKKKMSIDTTWKIAKFFGTDIRALIESHMWDTHSNTDLLKEFLNTLYQNTENNDISWKCDGGVKINLDDRYKQVNLVSEDENDGVSIYHPDHLKSEDRWLLKFDIVRMECFDEEKDLVIIPYENEKNDLLYGYDFILLWKEEEWHWEKFFYTNDDPYGSLLNEAAKLYDLISSKEFDAKISSQTAKTITNYIKRFK